MIALFLLVGCVNDVFFPPNLWAWDSGDTSPWSADSGGPITATSDGTTTEPITEPTAPDVGVDTVLWTCDAGETAWSGVIRTTGWVGEVLVDMVRSTDDRREEHPSTLRSSDPAGAWDELVVGPLIDAVDPAAQVAGESSVFDCAADATLLTYVVRVYAADQQLLDCVVWGDDPAGAIAAVRLDEPQVLDLGGCRALP